MNNVETNSASISVAAFKTAMLGLWKDESAQGATEYILILAIVVGLAMMFGTQIKQIISTKLGSISSAISGFTPESGN